MTGAIPRGADGGPAATQPTTSATSSTDPETVTLRSMPPSGPRPTVTRLATGSATSKFSVEVRPEPGSVGEAIR